MKPPGQNWVEINKPEIRQMLEGVGVAGIAFIIGIAVLAGFVGFWLAKRGNQPGCPASPASQTPSVVEGDASSGGMDASAGSRPPALLPVDDATITGDLVVMDDQGMALLSCRELVRAPSDFRVVKDGNGQAVDRMRQLVADVVGRGLAMPGKTVEIMFDPAIQEGLRNGAYEVVKVSQGDGHRLMARAIEGKQFVGHGRFMAAGKLRQIGVGTFNIVSIAVAQAHLAEINKNLEIIKEGVKDIRDFLEAKDIADLAGTIDYLEYVVGFIRRLDAPDAMPQEKRNQLESIRREIMSWSVQVIEEARKCQAKIEAQRDADTFGSGNNLKALRDHGRACEAIVRKYKLLMRMASLFYGVEAYLSPLDLRGQERGIRIECKKLDQAVFDMLAALDKKPAVMLQSNIISEATLKAERAEISGKVNELHEIRRSLDGVYAAQEQRIHKQLLGLQTSDQKLRMAVRFDAQGQPCELLIPE